MHRTTLYLTAEQEEKLDARARAAGMSRSALVRAIIDQELSRPQGIDADLELLFGQLADGYERATSGLFDDDADLRIDR